MAIYTPREFAGRDDAAALQLIRDFPFATLITSVPGAEPRISYVPLLHEDGALLGHLARANPHWQAFAQGSTVALFHGPHAFVSPAWYERPQDNVPTWNYAVVHAHGQPELADAAHTRAHLERLFARFSPGTVLPTTPEKVERLLGALVPFRMPIARLEAKFKMNQNKTPADRAGVIRGLRASGFAEAAATADWMQAHEPG
jgi:transcriptional regulator